MMKIGRYIVDEIIAQGGMSVIYRARRQCAGGIEKKVALKCLLPEHKNDAEFINMLREEAELMSAMQHPNICTVYGFEYIDGDYVLVLEYLEGEDLHSLLERQKAMSLLMPRQAAAFIAYEVSKALSYVHEAKSVDGGQLNIIHRDINPKNIFITKSGYIKLLDFGVAKSDTGNDNTMLGTLKGKFSYFSPEHARGERLDQRTDIFALGAVIYELFCGEMVYPTNLGIEETLRRARMAEIVPMSDIRSDIPEDIQKLVYKALSRDLQGRFQKTTEVETLLGQYLHGQCEFFDNRSLSRLLNAEKPGETQEERNNKNLNGAAEAITVPDIPERAKDTATVLISLKDAKSDAKSSGQPVALYGAAVLLLGALAALYYFYFMKKSESIVLSSIPTAASIWKDGKDTMLETTHMMEASGEVVLKKAFYEDYHVDWSVARDRIITANLRPKKGTVKLTSVPSGVKIYINRDYKGVTPVELELPMNTDYTVEYILDGYEVQSHRFGWKDESEKFLSIDVTMKEMWQ